MYREMRNISTFEKHVSFLSGLCLYIVDANRWRSIYQNRFLFRILPVKLKHKASPRFPFISPLYRSRDYKTNIFVSLRIDKSEITRESRAPSLGQNCEHLIYKRHVCGTETRSIIRKTQRNGREMRHKVAGLLHSICADPNLI